MPGTATPFIDGLAASFWIVVAGTWPSTTWPLASITAVWQEAKCAGTPSLFFVAATSGELTTLVRIPAWLTCLIHSSQQPQSGSL